MPRNLIDDFHFSAREQVVDFYEANEPWFLHPQLSGQYEELKKRFCEPLHKRKGEGNRTLKIMKKRITS
ncbi:MAG: hypothetical protein JXB88_25775 [Spirochaetales bacterium]|nr:hypothetical protein [Spirochaetales bacterium]